MEKAKKKKIKKIARICQDGQETSPCLIPDIKKLTRPQRTRRQSLQRTKQPIAIFKKITNRY